MEIAPRERPPFETVEVTVSHVAGNIYQIRGEGGNIGMSVGEDGIVLIDDQFAPLTEKILAAIRSVSAPGSIRSASTKIAMSPVSTWSPRSWTSNVNWSGPV